MSQAITIQAAKSPTLHLTIGFAFETMTLETGAEFLHLGYTSMKALVAAGEIPRSAAT